MIDDPDHALLERYLRGDAHAFRDLVVRYQRPVYNAAFGVLRHADDARDVAQTVFLRVAERAAEFDGQYRVFSWIYRIAINESLNVLRRSGREEALGEEDDLPGEARIDPQRHAEDGERARRVHEALTRLPVADRTVLTLRHFAELSYAEIAAVLELDEKTVKSRLYEARQRLKALLPDL